MVPFNVNKRSQTGGGAAMRTAINKPSLSHPFPQPACTGNQALAWIPEIPPVCSISQNGSTGKETASEVGVGRFDDKVVVGSDEDQQN